MNKPSLPVPLFFITGFLGSGKTTLLNRLLDETSARGQKIGVVINEWGRVNIDSGLLPTQDIEVTELNDGQGLFAQRPLDIVIVETSGMSNPAPLKRLLAELRELIGLHYDYRGMTALVDPENFMELVEDLPAVEEQIIGSQRVIINKIDLAGPEALSRIRGKIKALNPAAEILEASYGQVRGFLDAPSASGGCGGLIMRRATPKERPVHYIISSRASVTPEQAEAFARAVLPEAFRVKGFVRDAQRGWFYLDGVNDKVASKPVAASGAESKIVIIPKSNGALGQKLAAAWQGACGVACTIS